MSKGYKSQEAILKLGQVGFLLRRLTQSALEVFTHIYDQTKQHVKEKREEHLLEEYWRACLPSVKLWNTELQSRLAAAVTSQVDGVADLADFAFLKYCQLNYGKDIHGNINILKVTKPTFTELYHKYLCRLAFATEIIRLTALTNTEDLERACSGAFLDALFDTASSRFVITEVIPAAEWARRKMSKPATPSLAPIVSGSVTVTPGPSEVTKPSARFTPSFDKFPPATTAAAVVVSPSPSPTTPSSPSPAPSSSPSPTPVDDPPSSKAVKKSEKSVQKPLAPLAPLEPLPLPRACADTISATWHESLVSQSRPSKLKPLPPSQTQTQSLISEAFPIRSFSAPKITTTTTPALRELTPSDSTSQIHSFAKTYQRGTLAPVPGPPSKPLNIPRIMQTQSVAPLPSLPSLPAKPTTSDVASVAESIRRVPKAPPKPVATLPPGVSFRNSTYSDDSDDRGRSDSDSDSDNSTTAS